MFLWPRNKYSLRNCNPPEKKVRRKINKIDFKTSFPYYTLEAKNKIDLGLLRRFLYKNNIKSYHLYTPEQIDKQKSEREKVKPGQRRFIVNTDNVNRFELIDIE